VGPLISTYERSHRSLPILAIPTTEVVGSLISTYERSHRWFSQCPQLQKGVKKSFPPQRGGIFVESGSRGPAPQRGAISLCPTGQFLSRLQFSLNAENTAPRWGAAAATRASTNMPPRWGEEDFFNIFFSCLYLQLKCGCSNTRFYKYATPLG
jgi:hypothetical protein